MDKFCKMLKAAIPDEYQASKMYKKMAAIAPSKCAREILLRQSRDEAMHYRNNKVMYKTYCKKKC